MKQILMALENYAPVFQLLLEQDAPYARRYRCAISASHSLTRLYMRMHNAFKTNPQNNQMQSHLMMTYITRQFPTKPTTNTTEYTATMMGMMGDSGSGSASQVPLGV